MKRRGSNEQQEKNTKWREKGKEKGSRLRLFMSGDFRSCYRKEGEWRKKEKKPNFRKKGAKATQARRQGGKREGKWRVGEGVGG